MNKLMYVMKKMKSEKYYQPLCIIHRFVLHIHFSKYSTCVRRIWLFINMEAIHFTES